MRKENKAPIWSAKIWAKENKMETMLNRNEFLSVVLISMQKNDFFPIDSRCLDWISLHPKVRIGHLYEKSHIFLQFDDFLSLSSLISNNKQLDVAKVNSLKQSACSKRELKRKYIQIKSMTFCSQWVSIQQDLDFWKTELCL